MAMPTRAVRSGKLRWALVDIAVVAYALGPVAWLVSLSLKTPRTLSDRNFFPREMTLDNYASIFTAEGAEFLRPLINSIGIAMISTAIAVVLGAMAGYAVARLDFAGRRAVIWVSLLVALFPQASLVAPLFEIERGIGLFDTWLGLILPYVTFALPLAIYTMAAFYRQLPADLEKAAKMDGATPWQAWRKVIVPLAAPGALTSAILVFLFCWNDFLFAISLTSTETARTAPAALAFFAGSARFTEPAGTLSAAAVVITVPIVGFVLFFQRRIVAGLTAGAVRG